DVYTWDDTASTWMLSSQERRHINSASLPDSVFTRSINNMGSFDTSYQKLAYNVQNNPIYQRYYDSTKQLQNEVRYYYAPVSVGVNSVAAASDITAYPNPAANTLYIKGSTLSASGKWQY